MKELKLLTDRETGLLIYEEWKDIPEFKSIYQISNYGRVKSLLRKTKNGVGLRIVTERIRATHFHPNLGYWMITLKNLELKINKRYSIHRLVAEAFLPNPLYKPEVNHKDSNKLNSFFKNLEWSTESENVLHSYRSTDRIGANTGNRYGKSYRHTPIIQLTKQGKKIKDFDSIRRASHELGVSEPSICNCISGLSKTAGGFIWQCA